MSALNQIIDKSRDAHNGGFNVLSTGEQLAAALVLNRADLLKQAGFTMAEAIDRIGIDWVMLIPKAARVLHEEGLI